jgi:hypothetical protein
VDWNNIQRIESGGATSACLSGEMLWSSLFVSIRVPSAALYFSSESDVEVGRK